MLQNKSIVFLGDSFTWGEGLELYSNYPKWIEQREVDNNSWVVLEHKQDSDSILFRETNRYPYLVSKELNSKHFVDRKNGGNVARAIKVLERVLIENKGITDVVLQFSNYSRETLHMSYKCSCDFCSETYWTPIMDMINTYLDKKLENPTAEVDYQEQKVYDLISSKIEIYDINDLNFLEKADEYVQNNFVNQLSFLIENIFYPLNRDYNIRFHFIDSWCDTTSKLIKKNKKVKWKLIPLIGKDGKKYFSWIDWVSTFSSKSITDDFPKTNNGHPTLEMHQYLAKSVVSHFNTLI